MLDGNGKEIRVWYLVPAVRWIDGQDYMTAQRGVHVQPVLDTHVSQKAEAKKADKKGKRNIRVAALLRSLYSD